MTLCLTPVELRKKQPSWFNFRRQGPGNDAGAGGSSGGAGSSSAAAAAHVRGAGERTPMLSLFAGRSDAVAAGSGGETPSGTAGLLSSLMRNK